MDVDLFIKKMPQVIKELIGREAFDNRRSVNQEAIALLEEALVHRVGSAGSKRKQIEALLEDYADSRGRLPAGASDAFSGSPQGSAA
ncbi:MAG: Arc family DNA-binding protein [Pseudomonadota bacterium]|nr:Arc family DNA-binding protein [Pseudomonadota bacterium]